MKPERFVQFFYKFPIYITKEKLLEISKYYFSTLYDINMK